MEQAGKNYTKTLIAQASSGVRGDGPVDLWADKTTHRLLVDIGNPSITASPASNGATGSAVPAQADYIGVNSGGNLVGLAFGQNTMANSLPVTIASNQGNVPTNVAQINGVTVLMGNGTTGTGSQRVTLASDNTAIAGWGHGATGSAVPSGAIYGGRLAKTSLPAAGSDGNLVGAMADKYGRQVALLGTIRDLIGTQTTTISASTSETTIVTAAASVFNDLMMLIVSNTSAATNTRIDFRDTTGGTVLFSLQSNGGQPPIGFSLGGASIPQTTVNTNWTAQCATSTTDIRVYAVFAKNR